MGTLIQQTLPVFKWCSSEQFPELLVEIRHAFVATMKAYLMNTQVAFLQEFAGMAQPYFFQKIEIGFSGAFPEKPAECRFAHMR